MTNKLASHAVTAICLLVAACTAAQARQSPTEPRTCEQVDVRPSATTQPASPPVWLVLGVGF